MAFLTAFPLELDRSGPASPEAVLACLRREFPQACWERACYHDSGKVCQPPCPVRGREGCLRPVPYDYKVTLGFLPLNDCTKNAVRVELGTPELIGSIGQGHFNGPCHVLLTCYLDLGVAVVNFNANLSGVSTDETIFFRQTLYRNRSFAVRQPGNDDTHATTVGRLVWSYVTGVVTALDATGRTVPELDVKAALVEVTGIQGVVGMQDLLKRYPNHLYGLLTSDEGWSHVPADRAAERMTRRWATRDFVNIIPYGKCVLQINLADSPEARDYREREQLYWRTYFGEDDEYFSFRSPVAGLNHGSLFCLEHCLGIRVRLDKAFRDSSQGRIQHRIPRWLPASPFGQLRLMRRRRAILIATLNRLSSLSVHEMDELGQLVLEEMQVPRDAERLRDLLDQAENDLMIQYQGQTNAMVLFLTVLGVVLTFAGTCISWAAARDAVAAAMGGLFGG